MLEATFVVVMAVMASNTSMQTYICSEERLITEPSMAPAYMVSGDREIHFEYIGVCGGASFRPI